MIEITTAVLLIILASVFAFRAGINISRSRELDRWEKMFNLLNVDKANYYFSKGALWAYDIVVKEREIPYEPKTN